MAGKDLLMIEMRHNYTLMTSNKSLEEKIIELNRYMYETNKKLYNSNYRQRRLHTWINAFKEYHK